MKLKCEIVYVAFAIIGVMLPISSLADIVGDYEGSVSVGKSTTKIVLRCETESLCELEILQTVDSKLQPSPPLERLSAIPLESLKQVELSLQYLRNQKATIFTDADSQAFSEILKPVLNSTDKVQHCIDLQYGGTGASIICEVPSSIWGKPTVMYLGANLASCNPNRLFCGYGFFPLFQTDETTKLHATRETFVPKKFSPPPVPNEVTEYVKSIQDKVHTALRVPSGTPNDAKLDVQIQFNQNNGYIYSVNVQDGCICTEFRSAVKSAVKEIKPMPLLPPEKWVFLGGKNAKLYISVRAFP